MSYLRGDTYIWSDGEQFHIWVSDGYDSWDESDWAQSDDVNETRSSGVGVSLDVLDEFVVMRFAEIVESGLLSTVIDRSLAKGRGNGGSFCLAENVEKLKEAFRPS